MSTELSFALIVSLATTLIVNLAAPLAIRIIYGPLTRIRAAALSLILFVIHLAFIYYYVIVINPYLTS